MRTTRTFLLLSVGALAIAACGGGGGDAEETTTTAAPTTTSTTVPETTTTVPETTTTETIATTTTLPEVIRQPLTGQPLASADEIIQRPALVAKIDNVDARQNHTGLAVADIVYEEVVEGRATRFAAVFHSQSADPLGPIRSGRTQDVLLFSSYNSPLFVWSGGNGNVTRIIDESTLINMGPSHADGYFRGPGTAPHNLYNSTDAIWLQTPADHPGPPAQNFQYLATVRRSPAIRRRGLRGMSAAPRSTGSGIPKRASTTGRRTARCTSTRRTVRSPRRTW